MLVETICAAHISASLCGGEIAGTGVAVDALENDRKERGGTNSGGESE